MKRFLYIASFVFGILFLMSVAFWGISQLYPEKLHIAAIDSSILTITLSLGVVAVLLAMAVAWKTGASKGNKSLYAANESSEAEELSRAGTGTTQRRSMMKEQIEEKRKELFSFAQTIEGAENYKEQLFWKFCDKNKICQAVYYIIQGQELLPSMSFAVEDASKLQNVAMGEGLLGQAAVNIEPLYLQDVPEGYMRVVSGLGEEYPTSLYILPLSNKEEKMVGIMELASFAKLTEDKLNVIQHTSQEMLELFATSSQTKA